MDYIVRLDQISKGDLRIAGGKGANLGEMIKIGIPVPPGFAVTTASFDLLMQMHDLGEKIRLIINNINVDDTAKLLDASKEIKAMVLSHEMPLEVRLKVEESYKSLSDSGNSSSDLSLVAVRSSATAEDLPTASFAGQQASFLNVKGSDELVGSIKKCWASLFEPRAIFYRAKHGFAKSSISVIVQKMIEAEKSGVMFTVDPTTGENVVLIEATWGLGESIVGGEVSPDSYKVNKNGEIIDVQVSNKTRMRMRDPASNTTVELDVPQSKATAQVLTKDEILKLAEFGLILERHYGRPQDIEFAVEKGKIAIVQTRAITTKGKTKKIEIEGRRLLKGVGASPGAASGKVRIVLGKDDIAKINKGDIIVTAMTSPDLVPAMSRSAAIITDLGGRTSHAAIVSREMSIPAIVGAQHATRILKDGQEVTVDAYDGVVYDGRIKVDKSIEVAAEIPAAATKTKVKVNLAFVQRLNEIASKADGVGLLRIEHLITQFGVHPSKLVKEGRQEEYIKILIDGIRPIAEAFNPKPVWVRTLDARSDEFRNLKGGEDEPQEANPMLGWHGIRRSLDEPELLKSEFQAIKRMHEDGLTNLQVMLPFVISTEEVQKARRIACEVGLLDKAKIGIMVETPASVFIIEDFCKEGIAFASFGTNDLTQLTLGIDRGNERLANLSSAFHPAVLRSMKEVIDVCNHYGVETSICGESGSDPEMAKILVKYGIKSVSCNIDAINAIRIAVHQQEQELS
ncbi:MAG: phosphoenolpyruvate synthase [Nitrososphaera sp.]|nr:phosphoenolpyruvate synthase [Nitrososphaera sp.]